MYCGKCGSEIDKKTGLCPNCDAAALEKVTEANTKKSLKKAKRRGFSAIIALILVIAIVVSSVIFAISKGWIGNNSEEEKKKVQTIYITYLNKTIIPDVGEYDSDHPESSNEGVHSALFCDLNNDDNEEFVVAYSKKNGDNIDFNISCYEYEEETKDPEKAEKNVELIGTVTPSTEPDYTEDNDDVFHLPNETIVYSITYENETYIVCEHMSWMDMWSYECHIYKIEKGTFIEVSNIFVPDIGTDGARIVYSTNLPDKLVIDNSDFNVDLSSTQEYNKGVFYNEDCKVLFYKEGENSTYIYDKYYNSEESAVADFFKCYGIENKQYHTEQDGHIAINHPDKSDLIYSYCYYLEYDEDGNTIEKYNINDYTDWKSLINEVNENESNNNSIPEPNINELVNSASKITCDMFSFDMFDAEKSCSVHRDGTDYDVDCFYVKYKNIKTWNDYCNYIKQYYSEESVKNYFNEINPTYIEKEDGLYAFFGDVGSTIMKSYIVYKKENSEKYNLKIYSFYGFGGENEPYIDDIDLIFDGNNWVFNKIINYDVYDYRGLTVINENDSNYESVMLLCQYMQQINNLYNNSKFDDYFSYGIYDIDKDKTPELIVQTGESEQERKYHFYKYSPNGIISLGELSAWHSSLLTDSSNSIYGCSNSMGYYSIVKYSIENNKIMYVSVDDGEIDDDRSWDDLKYGYEDYRLYEGFEEEEYLLNDIMKF